MRVAAAGGRTCARTYALYTHMRRVSQVWASPSPCYCLHVWLLQLVGVGSSVSNRSEAALTLANTHTISGHCKTCPSLQHPPCNPIGGPAVPAALTLARNDDDK